MLFSFSTWLLRAATAVIFVAIPAGCTSAVESGHNTFLDSDDLIKMTDQMAASIAGSPEVNTAIAEQGKLRVVVQPVVNEMEAAVLPPGQADAFTARVRYLLGKHAPDRFTWIMNRDAYYRLRGQELSGVPLGPAPEAISPRYGLVARFRSLADESSSGRSDAYLCVFELTDLQTRTILWTDKYEVKKSATKGFLD
jgi:PBP1b-binding outer membrane lipoprotein LpoB